VNKYGVGLIAHSAPGDLRAAFNNDVTEMDVIHTNTLLP
jgi:hypothetical protein